MLFKSRFYPHLFHVTYKVHKILTLLPTQLSPASVTTLHFVTKCLQDRYLSVKGERAMEASITTVKQRIYIIKVFVHLPHASIYTTLIIFIKEIL